MKKLKKKFIAGTAFAIGALASVTGCGPFAPSVYGPAPSEEIKSTSEEVQYQTMEDQFDPAAEVQEDVYGPPEWFEGTSGDETQ